MKKCYFKYTDRTLFLIEVRDEVDGYTYIKKYQISGTGFIYFLINKYEIIFSKIIEDIIKANEHNYEVERIQLENKEAYLDTYNVVIGIHLDHRSFANNSIDNNIDNIIDQYNSASIYSYYHLHIDAGMITYEEYYKLSTVSNPILTQDNGNLKKLLMKDIHILRFNNILEAYKLYNFKQSGENMSLMYSTLKFDINTIMDYYTKYDCSINQIAEDLLSSKGGRVVENNGMASFVNVDLNYNDPSMSDRTLKNLRLYNIVNNL